jgi:hypothetical protein
MFLPSLAFQLDSNGIEFRAEWPQLPNSQFDVLNRKVIEERVAELLAQLFQQCERVLGAVRLNRTEDGGVVNGMLQVAGMAGRFEVRLHHQVQTTKLRFASLLLGGPYADLKANAFKQNLVHGKESG